MSTESEDEVYRKLQIYLDSLPIDYLKKYANPAQYVNSNFFAEIEEERCSGCAECVVSCHMGTNAINEKGFSEIDLGYCIGYGVCIRTCLNKARYLVKKTTESIPPKKSTELYQSIAKRKVFLQEKRIVDSNYRRVKIIK